MSRSETTPPSSARDLIVAILADVAMVDSSTISDTTKLVDDLGFDSLDLLEVVERIEKVLRVRFSDRDMTRASVFESVQALAGFVEAA
ncbi:hypothetical protein LUPAC06_02281 [Micromonospora saelicesensis]|uniref:acyl carrier protein n=1 Tax=Micromonospora saelicesensis TaxID=285676 RepID=UPI000DC03C2F|nr:acyl carrier protein [Micromonospora saelicesensis]RAO58691.1 hypothetical protein LUPAC06_02281 [Micromonospora saelicesensis]